MNSVIVATCNRLPEILRLIDSLLIQTKLPQELIIIDSSDKSLKQIAQFQEKIQKIQSFEIFIIYSSVKSLTYQRNIGIKKSKGQILYFFDDDIILDKNFLLEMSRIFENQPSYMGGMGNIFEKRDKFFFYKIILGIYSFGHRIFFLEGGSKGGKFSLVGFPNHPHGSKIFMEVECLSGCCMVYKKMVFENMQFDTYLSNYSYMEDCDFSRRVSLQHKLFYNPRSICEHRHGKGGRGMNLIENRKQFMFNFSYLFFKNFYIRKYYIFAYLWSVLGLYIESLFLLIFLPKRSFSLFIGYSKGLYVFFKKK